METISISTDFSGHTHRETISTRNNIAIINHLSLNALNCVIIATKTYLCLDVSILWNDLESSRMCLWNKIPMPPFGARSYVYHPCNDIKMNFCLNMCISMEFNSMLFRKKIFHITDFWVRNAKINFFEENVSTVQLLSN